MISNGATVTAGFKLGKELGVPDIRQSNWVAASYRYKFPVALSPLAKGIS